MSELITPSNQILLSPMGAHAARPKVWWTKTDVRFWRCELQMEKTLPFIFCPTKTLTSGKQGTKDPNKLRYGCKPAPLSIWTSKIFLSRVTFLPWHSGQRSSALILSPCPSQSPHIDWLCCTNPGAICWIRTFMPVPRHPGQGSTEPFFPPRPTTKRYYELRPTLPFFWKEMCR